MDRQLTLSLLVWPSLLLRYLDILFIPSPHTLSDADSNSNTHSIRINSVRMQVSLHIPYIPNHITQLAMVLLMLI